MKMMIQRLKDTALGEVHYVSRVHYAGLESVWGWEFHTDTLVKGLQSKRVPLSLPPSALSYSIRSSLSSNYKMLPIFGYPLT